MTDNVIDLNKRLACVANDDVSALDAFLVAEGLDLIAAFRKIEDEGLRASVVKMIQAFSAASKRKVRY